MSDAEDKSKFYKLSPIEAETPELEESFDYVFENDDITNVAVCGSFSSGKSSIMKWALHRQEGIEKQKGGAGQRGALRSVSISIAHFSSIENEDNSIEDEELSLEANLLSQLVHQINPSRIKNSRFVPKRKAYLQRFLLFLALFCLIAATAFFVTRDIWIERFSEDPAIVNQMELAVALVWVISLCAVVAMVVLSDALRGFIKRLDIPGIGTAEIGSADYFGHAKKDEQPSSLDKYLDDILRLLIDSKVDVVVFEDLDRWNNVAVFEKLRQINCLANSESPLKKAKWFDFKKRKPIRFFYLCGDDLFNAEERVKFFDFMITVLPYSDYSNSADLLIERMDSIGVKVDQSYLVQLASYIADSRLINNIVNEYSQFAAWRDPSTLDNRVENEKVLGLVAYKNLYPEDYASLQRKKGYVYALLESRQELINSILNGEAEDGEDGNGLDFSRTRELASTSLRKLLHIGREFRDSFFNLELVPDSIAAPKTLPSDTGLIEFLVWNGYLDQGYWLYTSRFRFGRLGHQDRVFMHALQSGSRLEVSFELNNVSAVESRMLENQFAQEEARIYQLAANLLNRKMDEHAGSFIEGIRRDEDCQFVVDFMLSGNCGAQGVCNLANAYPDCILPLLLIESDENEEVRQISKLVVASVADPLTLDAGIRKRLVKAISSDVRFFALRDENVSFGKLKSLGVEFQDIDAGATSKQDIVNIAKNGLFEASPVIVKKLLVNADDIDPSAVSNDTLLSVLCNHPSALTRDNIDTRIGILLGALLSDQNYKPSDDAVTIEWILHREDIAEDAKRDYIQRCPGSGISLEGLDRDIWEDVLNHDVANFDIDNVVAYYDVYAGCFDPTLAGFFNRNITPGVLSAANVSAFDDHIAFFRDLFKAEEIDPKALDRLFSGFGYLPSDIEVRTLDKSYIELLLNHGCFEMTATRLDEFRNYAEESVQEFISLDIDSYIGLSESGDIAAKKDEIEYLLQSDEVAEAEKLRALASCSFTFPIQEDCEDRINEEIIRYHFDPSDLVDNLGRMYGDADSALQDAIIDRVVTQLKSGYAEVHLDNNATARVLRSDALPQDTKDKLLMSAIKRYKYTSSVKRCVSAAGHTDISDRIGGSAKRIVPTPFEDELIEYLGSKSLLGKKTPMPNQPGVYMLHGKRKVPKEIR